MKYLALIILFFPGYVSACIIGPKVLSASAKNGFSYSISSSGFCENCNAITITAPKQYNNRTFAHGLFTLTDQKKILSRSIHSSINEAGQPEFTGTISGNQNINYEITFEYGNGHCMPYKFIHKNTNNGT